MAIPESVLALLTKDVVLADLNHPEGTIKEVVGDPLETNNRLYVKVGASGTGSWEPLETDRASQIVDLISDNTLMQNSVEAIAGFVKHVLSEEGAAAVQKKPKVMTSGTFSKHRGGVTGGGFSGWKSAFTLAQSAPFNAVRVYIQRIGTGTGPFEMRIISKGGNVLAKTHCKVGKKSGWYTFTFNKLIDSDVIPGADDIFWIGIESENITEHKTRGVNWCPPVIKSATALIASGYGQYYSYEKDGDWEKWNLCSGSYPLLVELVDTTTHVTPPPKTAPAVLDDLRDAILDPFRTQVNIVCIGDSTVWGLGATGTAPNEPRAHLFTDPRNNLTSPCWVNRFRTFLGTKYAGGVLTAGAPGVGTYSGLTNIVGPSNDDIQGLYADGSAFDKFIGPNASDLSGEHIDLLYDVEKCGLEFDMIGDQFTVLYSQMSGVNDYRVFVDGVQLGGTYPTTGTVMFNAQRLHTFAYGQHRIRIENANNVVNQAVRISGFILPKSVRIANHGIIGTETGNWLYNATPSLLEESLTDSDEFVIIGLGLNDRTSTVPPTVATKVFTNVTAIVQHLQTSHKKKIILMAPVPVTQSEVGMKFKVVDVYNNLALVSSKSKVPMIDNSTVVGLADGLHPNDAGYQMTCDNLIKAIGLPK